MGLSMQTQSPGASAYSAKAITRYRDRMPQHCGPSILASMLEPQEADLDRLQIDECEEHPWGPRPTSGPRLLLCQDECMESGAIERWSPGRAGIGSGTRPCLIHPALSSSMKPG